MDRWKDQSLGGRNAGGVRLRLLSYCIAGSLLVLLWFIVDQSEIPHCGSRAC
jgi:hypothetical protein